MMNNLKNNEKGVVLITVVMIVIVLMVLTISVISMNVSQVGINESEIQKVRSEIIGMGAITQAFQTNLSTAPGSSTQYNSTMESRTYQIVTNMYGATGPLGTTEMSIYIDY